MTGPLPTGFVDLVGVLEVGGSHVTSALADRAGLLPGSVRRRAVDPAAPAEELLSEFTAAMVDAGAPATVSWAIAIPGPFDYGRGIGLFEGVGKFDALFGVDLASGLRAGLPHGTGRITFVNDADAFAVGEWRQGVAAGAARCAGITLGSGVGSSFLHNGVPVTDGPTVPPEGRAHRLKIGTDDLEDVVSRRAILARYLSGPDVTRTDGLDVQEVFDRSRRDDSWATQLLTEVFDALGVALAPWLTRFGATVVTVGGAMIGSWDLIRPALRHGLRAAGAPSAMRLLPSADTERSALLGASTYTRRGTG